MKIDRALAERLSNLPWVDKVVYQTLESFRQEETKDGVKVNTEIDTYLTVTPKSIYTRDKYLETALFIQSELPEVKKWDKKFSGHYLSLEYKEGSRSIAFEFWGLSDEDYGSIIGCNLVKKKSSYSTLVCELKQ